jgi:hypothetical protein
MSSGDVRRPRSRQGQAFILYIFAIIVMVGVAALAVDVGRLCVLKTELQTACDAAALAAADCLPDATDAQSEARVLADMNYALSGFDSGPLSFTFTHPYKGDDNLVRVDLVAYGSFFFAPLIGTSGTDIAVGAAAESLVSGTMPFDHAVATCSNKVLNVSGSENQFIGSVYTNGGWYISGSVNTVTDALNTGGSFYDGGGGQLLRKHQLRCATPFDAGYRHDRPGIPGTRRCPPLRVQGGLSRSRD